MDYLEGVDLPRGYWDAQMAAKAMEVGELLEARLRSIAATTALLARQLDLHDKAQALIEDVFGPNCALCGQPSRRSFRTDTNVHSDCWRREKTGEVSVTGESI